MRAARAVSLPIGKRAVPVDLILTCICLTILDWTAISADSLP
jgi:hypothetical protein